MTYEDPDAEAQAEAKPAMKNGILAARSEAGLGDHHEVECDSRPNYPRLQARAAQAPSKPAGAGRTRNLSLVLRRPVRRGSRNSTVT